MAFVHGIKMVFGSLLNVRVNELPLTALYHFVRLTDVCTKEPYTFGEFSQRLILQSVSLKMMPRPLLLSNKLYVGFSKYG